MKLEYIDPVIDATQALFQRTMNTQVQPTKTFFQESAESFYEVSGMIDFMNGVNGSLIVSFREQSAIDIVALLFKLQIQKLDDMVIDGVGEITNLICGNSKSGLSKFGWHIQLSIPHVVVGNDYSIQRPKGVISVSTMFDSPVGEFMIDLSVKPESSLKT